MLEEDPDDEWYINSITRYKELIMLNTGDPVFQVELCDQNRICILSERSPDKRFISILSLPPKISKSSPSHIVKQNGDLKIISGVFPKSNPTQILAVYENDRLVSSQEDIKGVLLYSLKHYDSDQISLDTTLNYPLGNPYIALIEKDQIVMTKYTKHACLVGDLNSETVVNSVTLEETNDTIKPTCLDPYLVAFSLKKLGITHLFDRRSNKVNEKINVAESSELSWACFADYEFYKTEKTQSNLYFLTKSGHFKCYDLRNLSSPVVKCQIPLSTKVDDFLKIRFNPDNKDVLSISGFDDSIYLYNIKNEMTEVFRHDGHSKTEMCEKETIVSDHFWYTDEFVISSAFNNSINCWVANVNFNNIVV